MIFLVKSSKVEDMNIWSLDNIKLVYFYNNLFNVQEILEVVYQR